MKSLENNTAMKKKDLKKEVNVYTAPQSIEIALVAKQKLLTASDPEQEGDPGEDDPIFNDYGII